MIQKREALKKPCRSMVFIHNPIGLLFSCLLGLFGMNHITQIITHRLRILQVFIHHVLIKLRIT
ncbi:hypothetical protein APP67_24675 [Salmonella enterica subsp. enterica serovar Oranienburg]|nr:hypothetical protein APP67_24675 [Salmonella enterica subsp. enterica serovar Oranienburg]